jgi:serine/threonine protein phosphatase PrpC
MNLRYKTSVASEKGIREINEDFYLVIEHKKDTLIVLCDGVGSEEGSEIAALTTIKIFEKYFKRRIY